MKVSIGVFLFTSAFLSTTVSSTLPQRETQCPAIAGGQPNLELKSISADAAAYLKRYSLPADETALCRYLETMKHQHEAKVEDGLLDMMGDYFLATQKIATGYYFSYKIGFPGREIPKIIEDSRSSESEQADLFLKAIDSDVDPVRKAVFDKKLKELSPSNRKDGALKLIQLLFQKSWSFSPTVQQYLSSDSYHDDSYNFADRGLRTTSYAHMGTTVDLLFNADAPGVPSISRAKLESAVRVLPAKAKRILIVGPGLDFVHPELGEEIPQQSYEPFALLDTLLKSRKADFEDVSVDLFDISPRVVEHWEGLLKSANQGNPYNLTIVSGTAMLKGGTEFSNEITTKYVARFGDSLPGAVSSEMPSRPSRRPAPRSLDPYPVAVRNLKIPAAVIKKFHAFQGDLATTDLEKLALKNGGKYDLIFCFNTMEYLNETERALAGINIQESLADKGVFITDNRFETDLGERPEQPRKEDAAAKPIFESSFLEIVADVVNVTGRHTVLYRKGQK